MYTRRSAEKVFIYNLLNISIIKLCMLSVCVLVCMHALLTCMSQAEGPEAQVGSCVGDASQTVLYGVDGLVDS